MFRKAVVRSIWRARRFIDRAQSYTMAKEKAGSPITTWNEYLTHAKDVHKFTITVGTVQDNHHDCNNGQCRQDDNDYVNKKQRNQTDYHDFNNEQCRKEDNDYVNEKQHNQTNYHDCNNDRRPQDENDYVNRKRHKQGNPNDYYKHDGTNAFQKMTPETRRKLEKTFQNVGDVAHNAKPSFPRGAISRKYTFFQTVNFKMQ